MRWEGARAGAQNEGPALDPSSFQSAALPTELPGRRPGRCENCFRPPLKCSVFVFAGVADAVKDQKAEQQIRLVTKADEFFKRHFDFPSMRRRFTDLFPSADQIHC